MHRLALMSLAAFALAGCNTPAPQAAAPGAQVVTPADFKLPEGGGCAGDIARYRAIQGNDLAMGNVAQAVYDQIKAEIAGAERACWAGRDAEARSMILASRRRHGYPSSL
jgi:hypothetical protein